MNIDNEDMEIPVYKIKALTFSGKTGELQMEFYISPPHPDSKPVRLDFSAQATQELALSLARTHKFVDELLEGKIVTNVLQ